MTDQVFETPEAAEAAFYWAFSSIDLDLMTAVWADGETTMCIHPGSSLLRGKTAVVQSWAEIFSGSEPPLIECLFVDGFATEDLVVRLVEETIRPRDKPLKAASRILATNIYLRDGGSWRLVEHHASLPLVERGTTAGDWRQLH